MYLVCGSQVSVTVPDGSLPRGTMICAGPLGAALVIAALVEAGFAEVALEAAALVELADGVELDPHAATIAATTALITISSAFALVMRVPTMIFHLPLARSPLAAKALKPLRLRDRVPSRTRNCLYRQN